MKHIHFKILKINLVALLHICNFLKVRLLLFFLNHETKNKCKRVMGHENQLICVLFTYFIS